MGVSLAISGLVLTIPAKEYFFMVLKIFLVSCYLFVKIFHLNYIKQILLNILPRKKVYCCLIKEEKTSTMRSQ